MSNIISHNELINQLVYPLHKFVKFIWKIPKNQQKKNKMMNTHNKLYWKLSLVNLKITVKSRPLHPEILK